jgi:hypothetical protein
VKSPNLDEFWTTLQAHTGSTGLWRLPNPPVQQHIPDRDSHLRPQMSVKSWENHGKIDRKLWVFHVFQQNLEVLEVEVASLREFGRYLITTEVPQKIKAAVLGLSAICFMKNRWTLHLYIQESMISSFQTNYHV